MEIQPLAPEIIQDVNPTTAIPPDQIDATFANTTTDLISAPLGARILHKTDDFFASASNLISPTPPISRPGVFIETGAWYDGWETRRHNPHPPDHVTVRLGPHSGLVAGLELDTAHFTGNYGEFASVLGTYNPSPSADTAVCAPDYPGWTIILLPKIALGPSQRHAWRVDPSAEGKGVTHVRLNMYPDGGIARFRLYGTAVPDWPPIAAAGAVAGEAGGEVELSAAVCGGVAVAASNQHYSRAGNLLLPGRGKDMGDGWETRRSRGEGHVDWVVVRLGARGVVRRVVVDTLHFRGNYPRAVRVEGLDGGEGEGKVDVEGGRGGWVEVVGWEKCEKDKEHEFRVDGGKVCTHVKMVIEPDGGVKRFRVFGTRV